MEQRNNLRWYAPLAAQYEAVEEAMPLFRFAAIEAVLHLLWRNAPDADPRKAYLLFAQYHRIGAVSGSPTEYILQQARYTLGYYRSQKYWQDHFRAYLDRRYDAFRAFSVVEIEGKLSFSPLAEGYPYPYQDRLREWERFWTEGSAEVRPPDYAGAGTYRYVRLSPEEENGEAERVAVTFLEGAVPGPQPEREEKGPRPPITVSVEELLDAARRMEELCPQDPCRTVLETNVLKHIAGTSVERCDRLELREVVHLVGMVGAGKSTLIKVLAFWCHQHGYRIVIVVDTVAEVLNLRRYLGGFGIACSPLIGRNERLKYINQVIQPGELCLAQPFSEYLTPNCIVDGMDAQHATAVTFGKEPCYRLRKKGKYHLCPYFDRCSGTRMLRECYEASVVVTTVAGFAATRVGHDRELFLELAMRAFDLVVFDESDRVQKTLDQLFLPETSFNNYIGECAEECGAYMRLSSRSREEDPVAQRYDEMQRKSVTVLGCLIKAMRRELGAWRKITYGDPFSALTLLEDLYREENAYQMPEVVYRAVYQLIDPGEEASVRTGTLWAALESSCGDLGETVFNYMYQRWREELGSRFPQPEKERDRRIQDARLRLILKLIYFDHFIRDLADAYAACHETAYGQNELFGFLQTRFRQQQDLLPSALCGNLFGLKKTDEDDIILFRQFAFGRSLMKDLPYLRTNEQGRPAGPHALLLSGSSWAEGSYEYHVNRPVNYILEADGEKRAFLEKTRFFESGFAGRVSGAAEEQRMEQLRLVAQKSVDAIVRELNRQAGKILVVVNSYAQAAHVQRVLAEELRRRHCPAQVCRMISDAVSGEKEAGTVRRGEVSRFAAMEDAILIAPAMAIERGHNIVDESGHSALGAVFFFVRPMAVPDDIQQKGSKLNGLVEAHCKREPGEALFAYHQRVRQFAVRQWADMSSRKAFGLAELAAHERKDVVATLFVLILQIFGRLARVTDPTRPEPHVYFMDGAFRGREGKTDDFDCLSALGHYLETLMTEPESAEIARTLYAPFYTAYRKDIPYE